VLDGGSSVHPNKNLKKDSQPREKRTVMKNKMVAGILGILVGGFGIHKFYMGNVMPGVVYILLCWTGIPSILGLIEGIIYLMDTDEAFQARVEAKKFFM
jgi:TM2 domain-containing membrane protein YozV